jgi:hypothetical protein
MNYQLEKKYHVSFCGSYCHICDWHTGKIRKTYQAALHMLQEFGFNKLLEGKIDRENLTKGLEILANSSICPGCKQGIEKEPNMDRCKIRRCCSHKGFDLCNECADFPCELLKSNPGVLKFGCLENLDTIKEKGIQEWLDQKWGEYVGAKNDD